MQNNKNADANKGFSSITQQPITLEKAVIASYLNLHL